MSEKLMYIYDAKSKEWRAETAKDLGFVLLRVPNDAVVPPEHQQLYLREVPGLAGVWLDVPVGDVSDHVYHLIDAAQEACKPILGRIGDEYVKRGILTFIGSPTQPEVITR